MRRGSRPRSNATTGTPSRTRVRDRPGADAAEGARDEEALFSRLGTGHAAAPTRSKRQVFSRAPDALDLDDDPVAVVRGRPGDRGRPRRRDGVPVAMTSPGSSVNACEQWLMISATGEVHLGCAGVLEDLAVDGAADREPLRIADLVGGHEDRAHRAERVERLAAGPLAVAELEVAGRDVVEAGVAEDVVEGVARRRPAAPSDR